MASRLTVGEIRLTETCHLGGTSLPLHDHEDYTINLVLEGMVQERVGRRTHECGPGTLLAKPAGQHHANRYVGSAVRCVVVQLSGGLADHQWSPRLHLERVGFRKGEAVRQAAGALARALEQPVASDVDLAALLAVGRLLELCAARRLDPAPTQWVVEVRDLLTEPANAAARLTELSARTGVPPWMLSRAFERAYGLTPSQYRRRARLDWVARQLRDTDTPVSALAHASGFSDHSHLGRWFRRAYRCTPTEYRARTGRASYPASPARGRVTP